MKETWIAIDFDGTIVEHKYPDVGKLLPGVTKWIKTFKEAGAKIILYTMRWDSESEGPVLTDAIKFCADNGIVFDGIQTNPTQKEWTDSPKAYAQIYIDDHGLFCPLIYPVMGRPYVDWNKVGPEVMRVLTNRSK